MALRHDAAIGEVSYWVVASARGHGDHDQQRTVKGQVWDTVGFSRAAPKQTRQHPTGHA